MLQLGPGQAPLSHHAWLLLYDVDYPAALQYLDCLTDHYYGTILVMMHHVFEQVCMCLCPVSTA